MLKCLFSLLWNVHLIFAWNGFYLWSSCTWCTPPMNVPSVACLIIGCGVVFAKKRLHCSSWRSLIRHWQVGSRWVVMESRACLGLNGLLGCWVDPWCRCTVQFPHSSFLQQMGSWIISKYIYFFVIHSIWPGHLMLYSFKPFLNNGPTSPRATPSSRFIGCFACL